MKMVIVSISKTIHQYVISYTLLQFIAWWLEHILNLVQPSALSQDTKFQSVGENISSMFSSLQQQGATEIAQLQASLSTTQGTLQEEIESITCSNWKSNMSPPSIASDK